METSIVASSDYCNFCDAELSLAKLVFNFRTGTATVFCDNCGNVSIVGKREKTKGLPPSPSIVESLVREISSNPSHPLEENEVLSRPPFPEKTEKKYQCARNKEGTLQSEKLSIARTDLNHNTIVDLKKFKCSCCDYSSNYKSNVSKHEKIHTGEKPFDCNYCVKKFRWKSCLDSHISRKHKGEKSLSVSYL